MPAARDKRKKKKGEDANVDLTPMIDVVFQLIIFFVVTVNLDQQNLLETITLPESKNSRQDEVKDPDQITIQVTAKGKYYVGKTQFKLRSLRMLLKNTVARSPRKDIPILVRGDMEARHRYVRRVMDACTEAGLYKIRFAALKKKASDQGSG